ncbi:hypothetical protein CIPAW_11G066400 [Carya illinoinensis]|uniref:Uncharacterized protein n=1 Tax=Carya illinoinensis TaxID=32201 RepID=A0A8T1P4D7_CARIL|nr:hypothetical protein CIPAW_11G066400 [Carya illinoinensis]
MEKPALELPDLETKCQIHTFQGGPHNHSDRIASDLVANVETSHTRPIWHLILTSISRICLGSATSIPTTYMPYTSSFSSSRAMIGSHLELISISNFWIHTSYLRAIVLYN